MDKDAILDLLLQSIDDCCEVRQSAEEQLDLKSNEIGFCPKLLECVVGVVPHHTKGFAINQAAVICLKKNIYKHWNSRYSIAAEIGLGNPSQFVIHEQDKKIITDSIVDAIVGCCNELIATHLSSIVYLIIKLDFPHKWPDVVDKIHHYLAQSDNPDAWSGALVTFHQLVKTYGSKRNDRPLFEALAILLPIACERLAQLLQINPTSEHSCKLQKQILKIFYATLRDPLPLAIVSDKLFIHWITLIIEIANRDVPENVQNDVDKANRPDLVWWKRKKWSVHLLVRIFERYISLDNDEEEYNHFAQQYICFFLQPSMQAIIRILEQYSLGQYVTPRVMQQALNYLNMAVRYEGTENLTEADLLMVVEKIIFPLMCHSDEDEELWTKNPHQYISKRFDICKKDKSPVLTCRRLFRAICRKQYDIIQKTMTLAVDILNKQDPRTKDGVLHMVGSIANVLIDDPSYGNQMEQFVADYLYMQFSSPQGFLKARAYWTLNRFVRVKFTNRANLIAATNAVSLCITLDSDLPVKVEAALYLHNLLHFRSASRKVIQPHLGALTRELVNLEATDINENVMVVLEKMASLFPEDIGAIAIEITDKLAQSVHSLISESTMGQDKVSTTSSNMRLIKTVLVMMRGYKEVTARLEPLAVEMIVKILERNIKALFANSLTLLSTLTTATVSDETLRVLQTLYAVFKRDGVEYFPDMMTPICHYVTVDPDKFIASEQNVMTLCDMCQTILNDSNVTEEMKCYAAKLMEIIISQFGTNINHSQDLLYSFIELALSKLQGKFRLAQLKTLYMLFVIATIGNASISYVEECFKKWENQSGHPPNTQFEAFIQQWLLHLDELKGIHDRKMAVIAFSNLLYVDEDGKPPPLMEKIGTQILAATIPLLERQKVAYQKLREKMRSDKIIDSEHLIRAARDDSHNESDDSDDEDECEEDDTSSEDSESEHSNLYCDDDDCEPTILENKFKTRYDSFKDFIDEFRYIHQTLETAVYKNFEWFKRLHKPLTESQESRLRKLNRVYAEYLLWRGVY